MRTLAKCGEPTAPYAREPLWHWSELRRRSLTSDVKNSRPPVFPESLVLWNIRENLKNLRDNQGEFRGKLRGTHIHQSSSEGAFCTWMAFRVCSIWLYRNLCLKICVWPHLAIPKISETRMRLASVWDVAPLVSLGWHVCWMYVFTRMAFQCKNRTNRVAQPPWRKPCLSRVLLLHITHERFLSNIFMANLSTWWIPVFYLQWDVASCNTNSSPSFFMILLDLLDRERQRDVQQVELWLILDVVCVKVWSCCIP